MSIEFEEYEDPLARVGAFILLLASALIIVYGAIGSTIISGGTAFDASELSVGYTFMVIFLLGLLNALLALFSFIRPWINRKINVFIAAVVALVTNNAMILMIPGGQITSTAALILNIFVWIGIGAVFLIFIAKRPNLGKESDKHIYQAYGGFIDIIVGIFMVLLGLYVYYIDISQFAGSGTFPGGLEAFSDAYIEEYSTIEYTYESIRESGLIMLIGGLIIIGAAAIRNYITLTLASGVIIAGIITSLVGLILFFQNWQELDSLLRENYPDQYFAQLILSDPIVLSLGAVLMLYLFLGVVMIIYASSQSQPLEKWKTKRNHNLAAAEVAIRDQKLNKAIDYLETAAKWSSKLGEEDKAVELITRINNIKEKAIKMRKAEAAEKKKKELQKAKEKAEEKAPSVKK
ncbi:MAG: hypothetical protein R6U96_00955 [Promethearchaeia archaeon]